MLERTRQVVANWIAPPRTAVRRFDGAGGGRRWSASPSFGRFGAEALAAAGPIRSRARYFTANNPWASNGVAALVAGLVGCGITPASAHPDAATRKVIDAAVKAWARVADADGRTDVFGLSLATAPSRS